MPSDDEPDANNWGYFRRRHLLLAMGTATASGLAGCSVSVDEGGVQFELGDDAETTTPTYTYGGSPSGTETENGASDGSVADTISSPITDPSSTATTATSTESSSPEDEYGEQLYGEYGYGG